MALTSGNSAATGMSAGGQATGDIPAVTCQELEGQNVALRQRLAQDPSASVRESFAPPPDAASTVVHGSLNGGAAIGAVNRLLPARYNDLAQGLWAGRNREQRRQMRETGESNLCPEPPFTYGQGFRPHQSHCESKILETLFAPGGTPPSGTLTLNINWQWSECPNDKSPCEACERLLCHAQQGCHLTILLCKEDPQDPPEPPDC
jgi:hypothetical protein